MITYLPDTDFMRCASILNDADLKESINSAHLVLDVLYGDGVGWFNHPLTRMWRGYEQLLIAYCTTLLSEQARRGTDNNDKMCEVYELALDTCLWSQPNWMGGFIHKNHRSNLKYGDLDWYLKFNWSEPSSVGLFWPEV